MPAKPNTVLIQLGNPNPQMQVPIWEQQPDGSMARVGQESIEAPHLNQSVTSWWMEPDYLLDEARVEHTLSTDNDRQLAANAALCPEQWRAKYALLIHHAEHLVAVHSAGVAPTWVDCPELPEVAQVLADHFKCLNGQPIAQVQLNGRDAFHEQHLKGTGQPAGFEWGALSTTNSLPATSENTMAGEITTASGGLLRAAMEFAHTAGTNTSTLKHTWTANATDEGAGEKIIATFATFNKVTSGGTMGEIDKLASTASLKVNGDSITITWTLTAG